MSFAKKASREGRPFLMAALAAEMTMWVRVAACEK